MKTELTLILLSLFLAGCSVDERPTAVFRIPEDFDGFAIIIMGQEGFPKTEDTDLGTIYQLDEEGVLITSSRMHEGWGQNLYQFIDTNGEVTKQMNIAEALDSGLVHGGSTGWTITKGKEVLTHSFFVGALPENLNKDLFGEKMEYLIKKYEL